MMDNLREYEMRDDDKTVGSIQQAPVQKLTFSYNKKNETGTKTRKP